MQYPAMLHAQGNPTASFDENWQRISKFSTYFGNLIQESFNQFFRYLIYVEKHLTFLTARAIGLNSNRQSYFLSSQ